mgnify:CR=1 FL=1
MVHFVGAGPGGPDLITLRGAQLLSEADCVIYAGSLVNPALLAMTREGASIYNSAQMTLEQVLAVIREMEQSGKTTVRLHTGDPCLYGAIQEQMDQLDELGISWDVTPGVSSFCGAAAAVGTEYTLPGVSQSVIITRMAGRTPVPERESIAALAAHGATMVIFLSAGMQATMILNHIFMMSFFTMPFVLDLPVKLNGQICFQNSSTTAKIAPNWMTTRNISQNSSETFI